MKINKYRKYSYFINNKCYFKKIKMDEEKDIYNLPIAAFTFGKNGQAIPYFPIIEQRNYSNDNEINDSRKNISISFESRGSKESNGYSNEDSEKRFSFKNILKKNTNKNNNNSNSNEKSNKNFNVNVHNNNNKFDNNNFVFIDKEDSNSSYLKMILYSISYMKLLNNYFINELKLSNNQQNYNNEIILLIIRDLLIKIEQIRKIDKNINNSIHINNIINIEELKENLSILFKSKNKFQRNSPDNPIDFLFIIINSLHLLKLKKDNNDNSKIICSDDCFTHKHLSVNILKIYECECKGNTKKILSKNNYFLDIPINIINNKFSKNNLYDINQKLFIYYKHIIAKTNNHIQCPQFGDQCKINKVHCKFILKNYPSYFIFNLENDYFKINQLFFSLNNILKSFILIPHIFNINSIFDSDYNHNNNNHYNYELIGIIFLKISKVYTCMFKQNNIFNYYEDNIFMNFNNYYDIIIFCLKNGLIPVSLFYQNSSLNNNVNYELNKEQIIKLEKYVKNTNSLNKNLKNKIRTSENIISDSYSINYSIHSHKNNNNLSLSDNYNSSSRYSGSVNSYNSYQKNEYICNHCERINKIENKKCFFCGYKNNEKNPLLKNNIYLNSANNIIKSIKSHTIVKSSNSNKNIIKKNIDLTRVKENENENNQLGEIEDEYKNIDPHVLKYFDMPKAYIPQPPKKNELKTTIKQSPKLNKKIPLNNNSNNIIIKDNNPINFINNKKDTIKINNSPHKYINSESNTIESNILNNFNSSNNINNIKRNSNIIHKKRNSNSDNIINNNNYYSEHNNNQLNINLKINNNNNYNIFDFSNEKNLASFDDYDEQHIIKKNKNLTDKKLLRNINILKNKKSSKYTNNNNNNNEKKNKLNFNNNFLNKNNIGMNFPNNNENQNWICENCLNENNKENQICLKCKIERKNIKISNLDNFNEYFSNDDI